MKNLLRNVAVNSNLANVNNQDVEYKHWEDLNQ